MRARTWSDSAAFCVAALLGSLLFWRFVQRAAFQALLALGPEQQTATEARLIWATVCAETLLLVLPGLLLSLVLRAAQKQRAAFGLFVLWSSLVVTFETLDLRTNAAFGRHLSEIVRFAWVPNAAQVGGDLSGWRMLALRSAALGALASAALWFAARELLAPLGAGLSVVMRRLLAVLALPLFALGAALPWLAAVFYQHPDVRQRLYKQLIWPPPSPELAYSALRDPHWAALDAGLRTRYAAAFPRLFAHQPLTVAPGVAATRPNVVILLVESWRQDSLTPERMPRLSAWAERGLIAEQHYGGSDYSEAGMFSLLYARSPLLFRATLNAHEPAAWCPAAHALGMECNYYSGHPKIWMRREEFLNPGAVDHFVHDDAGDWPAWDRAALGHALQALHAPAAKPQVALVYLMSTHFEYEYPPNYERHLPVKREISWKGTDTNGLGAADQVPVKNRYLNSLAFIDDLLADAIEKLDPARNIIVLTGDHGESLGEDGHFGHGYGFPDSIAKVPFVVVGPGVPPSHRSTPSLHADLLPTLVHALGGHGRGPSEAHDLLAPDAPRSGLLLAHCSYTHQVADAVLISAKARIHMELGLNTPDVNLLWPEDAQGHPLATETIDAERVEELLRAFEAELRALYSPSRSL
jgi:hypothetical protein